VRDENEFSLFIIISFCLRSESQNSILNLKTKANIKYLFLLKAKHANTKKVGPNKHVLGSSIFPTW